MAKMYGFTGLLSGKMGNAVFRARSGQQVVTQYNPIVTNPNTVAQQNGRARFKLVSQLAVVFAATLKGFGSFIIKTRPEKAGRGINKSINAAFVGVNYKLTELDPSPTAAVKAVIPMEKVQLTNSNRPFGNITLEEKGEIGAKYISANIDAPQMADGDKVEVVVVGYDTMSVTKSPYVVEVHEATFSNGFAQVETGVVEDGQQYTILAFGVAIDQASVDRLALANMQSAGDYLAEVGISTLLKSGAGVVTATIGDNIKISDGE